MSFKQHCKCAINCWKTLNILSYSNYYRITPTTLTDRAGVYLIKEDKTQTVQ